MFSTFPNSNFNLWVTFTQSSANALNMGRSKILLFGKKLKLCNNTSGPWWPWIVHPSQFPHKLNFTLFFMSIEQTLWGHIYCPNDEKIDQLGINRSFYSAQKVFLYLNNWPRCSVWPQVTAWVVKWWVCRTHDLVLWVPDQVEAKFLFGIFSLLTHAEECEESSRLFWKEISVSTGVRKQGNTCASPTAMIWP